MPVQSGQAGALVGIGAVEVLLVVAVVALVGLAVVAVLLLSRRTRLPQDDLQHDLHEQRQDIERREHRLTERESRLDEEPRALRCGPARWPRRPRRAGPPWSGPPG